MAKYCLYCGLQFSDTTKFCPDCGRPTESGFRIRTTQELELARLRRERKEKADLTQRPVLTRTDGATQTASRGERYLDTFKPREHP